MIGFWAAWCAGCWLFGLTLDGVTLADEVGGGWKEEEETETPDPGEAVGILVEIEATLDDLKKKPIKIDVTIRLQIPHTFPKTPRPNTYFRLKAIKVLLYTPL